MKFDQIIIIYNSFYILLPILLFIFSTSYYQDKLD